MDSNTLAERRERVFLVLAGFFLCAMTLLNVIGITHFIHMRTNLLDSLRQFNRLLLKP